MNDATVWAISYFAARGDVPWRWADDGNVIVWADGTTIAFRDEIAVVLDWLAPQGWPPFGALVWLLAACRGKLPPRVTSPANKPAPDFASVAGQSAAAEPQLLLGNFEQRLRAMHAGVEDGLLIVSQLPPDLRSSPKAKAVLAETVFGSRPSAGRGELLPAVLEVLRSGTLTDTMLNDPGAPPLEDSHEWLALHEGLAALAPESLALRLRTGLDALPRAAELPLPPAGRVRALLDRWKTDPEHGALARLTRDFMAALQLPRKLSERDDLPIGGFSDIANRGAPDRLLLSELAHDDLVLAVRIALQEALYLRREPPVRQPPSTLSILIDCGLRLWGVPRVLATAVALALVAKGRKHEDVAVFRATAAETIAPADLLSREGVIAHLGSLEASVHPGAALPAFQAALREHERGEAVLITQREVVEDQDFRQCLVAAKFESLYLAIVDRDGSFELLRHPASGGPICRAQVNLDDLLPAPAAGKKKRRLALLDRELHPDLPLFLSADPAPLLFAVRGKVQRTGRMDRSGGVCVMQDRRLLAWDVLHGARTLAHGLPHGRTVWLGQHRNGNVGVVKMVNGRHQLFCEVFSPDGELLISQNWRSRGRVQRVECDEDILFAIETDLARAYHVPTGHLLGEIDVSRGGSHGRYFIGENRQWSLLVWTGQQLLLQPVLLPTGVPHEKVARMFHREGFEGPWCITWDGGIYAHTGQSVLQVPPIHGIVRVAENGDHLLVAERGSRTTHLVDLNSRRISKVQGNVSDAEWQRPLSPPTRSMRVRAHILEITPKPSLRLYTRSGTGCEICWRNDRIEIESFGRFPEPVFPSPASTAHFEPLNLPGAPGFSLKMAGWPDGRRAWLDDRGLLHLRPMDRRQPEVTLALSDTVSGWSSDGLWFGDRFFIGDHPQASAGDFWLRIGAFCLPTP